MVSHDLDQVRRVADRVTVLDRRVVAEGPRPRSSRTAGVRELLPARRREGARDDRLLRVDRRPGAAAASLPSDFQYPFLFADFSACWCWRRSSAG